MLRFGSADSKGVTGAFFVSADCKGVSDLRLVTRDWRKREAFPLRDGPSVSGEGCGNLRRART